MLTFICKYSTDYQPKKINEKQWEKERDKQGETSALILKIKPTQTNQPTDKQTNKVKPQLKYYNNPLDGILGFIYSHAFSGEKEYAVQHAESLQMTSHEFPAHPNTQHWGSGALTE